jgi:putative Mn2+ efflux pump MntP
MSLLEILLVAVSLAMDTFAVSIGIGTTGQANKPRPIFRLAFHFGLFQCLMPILGWLAGRSIADLISGVDHWVALGLLAFVGIRMIRSGLEGEDTPPMDDPSRGRTLIMLALATSIDALAVGLGLAMIRVNIIYPSVIIGIVTGSMSWLGLALGQRLGEKFGKRMEIVGGVILIAIGLRILIAHLT